MEENRKKVEIQFENKKVVYEWDESTKYWIAIGEPFFSSTPLVLAEKEMEEFIGFTSPPSTKEETKL